MKNSEKNAAAYKREWLQIERGLQWRAYGSLNSYCKNSASRTLNLFFCYLLSLVAVSTKNSPIGIKCINWKNKILFFTANNGYGTEVKEDIRLDVNYAPEVEVEEYFIHAR